MRHLNLVLLLLASTTLQTTLMTNLAIAGVTPHLVLILVVFTAILNGGRFGSIFGVCAGLFLDMLTGRYIGLNALALAATAGLCGFIEGRLYKDNLLVPIGCVLAGTFAYHTLAFLLGSFAGLPFAVGGFFMTLLTQALYNTAAVPLLYGAFYRVARKGWLPKEEVGS
ncbi:rod shape-determining protein MreD [Heliobacterium gestii]|uniref:Rod shape-determining protein MreD n=1 Tax=Heliomicrobium gestii TaxID=2699 RepID=A0A845L6L8_HELGE|nr:rod shape-determining protein MreD [Heliomicrobium gestii]MBM7866843.1 rod shape-determining protein MreD [Heliomicrobium gestii]MZP42272.1 rod shape-determining protein MreD [Heliomicrobium gestii]